jgi:hypothetical protein
MNTYARVIDGVVWEIIVQFMDEAGVFIPVEEIFPPEIVAQLVDVTGLDPQPEQGWTHDGSTFAAPVPYNHSAEEIKAINSAERDRRLALATLAIAPLQDAVDLDDASAAEIARLKLWKQYRVALNRVDLTKIDPVWPLEPQN